MKRFAILILILITVSISAYSQVKLIDGQLIISNHNNIHGILESKKSSTGPDLKVDLPREKSSGEITILSDLIVHQNLKMYVINPTNGKHSRIDLDEKSKSHGSVEVVKELIVKQQEKLYLVNPKNGKTSPLK